MTDWSKDKSWMKEKVSDGQIKTESLATGVGRYLGSQLIIRISIAIIAYSIIKAGGWLGLW